MPPRSRLGTAVQSRLDALVRDLPLAKAGQPDALHRTRVASRRVRAALPFLADGLSKGRLEKTARKARRITRALGSVRELDVALVTLEEIAPEGPDHRAALDLVRRAIAGRRDLMRQHLVDRLSAIKPERMIQKLTARLDERNGRLRRVALRQELGRAVTNRAQRLRKTIQFAGSLYLPDRLHAVRVGMKKLRYTLELAQETGASSARTLLRTLKDGQETLGRLHDLEVFIHLVRTVRTGGEARARDAAHHLDRLTAALERDCRTVHGRYSAMRPRLLAVCDTAIDRVAPTLMRTRARTPAGRAGHSAGRTAATHGATDRAVPGPARRRG